MKKVILAIFVIMFLMVPQISQAAIVDLALGDSGEINDALYFWMEASATGTGNIQSFSQIGGNSDVTQGYNTTVNGVLDGGPSANFNWQIPTSIIPIVEIEGVLYREFILDVNEAGGNKSSLSLDDLQIFLTGLNDPNQSVATFDGSGILELADATLIYRMDEGEDSYVKLDASRNSGSGSGDMILYVPETLFQGGDEYLYLYSRFGENHVNDGGFEEWAVRKGGTTNEPVVPEPATMVLFGSGLFGLAGLRKKKNQQ